MNVRTKVNTNYLARLALIGVFCLGFSLYCLYDGFIGYPNQQMRAKAFAQFLDEQNALTPPPEKLEIYERWKALASEKGWRTEVPGEPKKDYDILEQFLMAGGTGLLALFFLAQLFRWRGRWIEANDNLITSNRGHRFTLDQITALDKKKWDKKGIAKIQFQTDGKTGQLTLDDCNYDRDTTQEILRHIEANIDHAKILNGSPEPPPKTDKTPSTEEPDGPRE